MPEETPCDRSTPAARGASIPRDIGINLIAPLHIIHSVVPWMRSPGGAIVNTISLAAITPLAGSSVYSATKFGVVAFSEALRREVYQHNIRVTVIEPGVVETELRDHIGHAVTKDNLNAWADSMRQLQSVDVAEAITFCVSRPSHVNINEVLMRPTDQER